MSADFANNAHARANRAVKVAKLLATIDTAGTAQGRDVRSAAFADLIATKDSQWWALVARAADVNTPSEQTIAMVVAALRERPLLDDAVKRLEANNPGGTP
jgi:hypothetical protein